MHVVSHGQLPPATPMREYLGPSSTQQAEIVGIGQSHHQPLQICPDLAAINSLMHIPTCDDVRPWSQLRLNSASITRVAGRRMAKIPHWLALVVVTLLLIGCTGNAFPGPQVALPATEPPNTVSTAVPSATPSATPSPTSTLTPTASPTATATSTSIPTPTPSLTHTATPTPTPTLTHTATPTPTPTLTPTPPDPLDIEFMRREDYPGSDLVIEQTA